MQTIHKTKKYKYFYKSLLSQSPKPRGAEVLKALLKYRATLVRYCATLQHSPQSRVILYSIDDPTLRVMLKCRATLVKYRATLQHSPQSRVKLYSIDDPTLRVMLKCRPTLVKYRVRLQHSP